MSRGKFNSVLSFGVMLRLGNKLPQKAAIIQANELSDSEWSSQAPERALEASPHAKWYSRASRASYTQT